MWYSAFVGAFTGILVLVLLRFPGSYNVPRRAGIVLLPARQRECLHDLMREMMLGIFCTVQIVILTMVSVTFASARATTFRFPWMFIISFIVLPMRVVLGSDWRISRAADDAKREARFQ